MNPRFPRAHALGYGLPPFQGSETTEPHASSGGIPAARSSLRRFGGWPFAGTAASGSFSAGESTDPAAVRSGSAGETANGGGSGPAGFIMAGMVTPLRPLAPLAALVGACLTTAVAAADIAV